MKSEDILRVSNAVYDHSELQISKENIEKLVEKINFQKFFQSLNSVMFPLRFESVSDEFNFLLSNVLVQIDTENSKKAEKFAEGGCLSDSLLSGMIGTHLSGERWTGGYLRSLSKRHLSRIFNIPEIIWESVSLPSLPAITQEVSHPSEAVPYLSELESVLNSTGLRLQTLNKKDFADLFQLSTPAFLRSFADAQAVLSFLVESLPAFEDAAVTCTLRGEGVGDQKTLDNGGKEGTGTDAGAGTKGVAEISIRNHRRAQLAVYTLTARFPDLFSFVCLPPPPPPPPPAPACSPTSSTPPTSITTPSALLSSFFFIPTLSVTAYYLSHQILVPRTSDSSPPGLPSSSSSSSSSASSSSPSPSPSPSSSSDSASSSAYISNTQRLCAISATERIIETIRSSYLLYLEKEGLRKNGRADGSGGGDGGGGSGTGRRRSAGDDDDGDDEDDVGDGGGGGRVHPISDINSFTVLEYFGRILLKKH